MALSLAQRRRLVAELRDAVFRGCSALGVLAGMWWMLSTPVPARACVEPPAAPADPVVVIGECARQTILDSATHYGLGIGGGALLGMLAGVFLARLIPAPRPATSRPRDRFVAAGKSRTAAAPAPPGLDGRWITARYPGSCDSCAVPVRPGDRVRHRPGRVSCEQCASMTVR